MTGPGQPSVSSAPPGPGPGQPGVSVVIPAYNYARFLSRALDSALAQTHVPLEIIVVDDGSTDNTRALVAGYGLRVRYIYQANAGLSAARNTGIRASTHPLVAFLDADDEWLPEWVAHGVAAFAAQSPEYGIVACRAFNIDAEGRRLPVNKSIGDRHGELTAADILLMTRFSPSAVLARRGVFEECGCFDTTLRSSEDRDMWIRIAARYRVWLIPDRLALIRKHSSNMSSHADRMKLNMGRVIRKAWAMRAVPRSHVCFWLQVLAVWRYQTALIYLGLGRRLAALFDLVVSLICWPLPLAPECLNSTVSLIRLRALFRALRPNLEGGA